jgi:hypothetical protein
VLRVRNDVRSTSGIIEGITDQGYFESKSIGALESECRKGRKKVISKQIQYRKEEIDTINFGLFDTHLKFQSNHVFFFGTSIS